MERAYVMHRGRIGCRLMIQNKEGVSGTEYAFVMAAAGTTLSIGGHFFELYTIITDNLPAGL